jgi:hypothetical protein
MAIQMSRQQRPDSLVLVISVMASRYWYCEWNWDAMRGTTVPATLRGRRRRMFSSSPTTGDDRQLPLDFHSKLTEFSTTHHGRQQHGEQNPAPILPFILLPDICILNVCPHSEYTIDA